MITDGSFLRAWGSYKENTFELELNGLIACFSAWADRNDLSMAVKINLTGVNPAEVITCSAELDGKRRV